jgi:nucleolar protein 14
LARFRRERESRLAKHSLFSLEDGSSEDSLTHMGMTLGGASGEAADSVFKDEVGLLDANDLEEDEASGRIDAEVVDQLHFGGGEEGLARRKKERSVDKGDASDQPTEERQKTSKEIYKEVIEKSKAFKAEKARQQIEQQDRVSQLDSQFASIRSLLEFKNDSQKQKEKETVCPCPLVFVFHVVLLVFVSDYSDSSFSFSNVWCRMISC